MRAIIDILIISITAVATIAVMDRRFRIIGLIMYVSLLISVLLPYLGRSHPGQAVIVRLYGHIYQPYADLVDYQKMLLDNNRQDELKRAITLMHGHKKALFGGINDVVVNTWTGGSITNVYEYEEMVNMIVGRKSGQAGRRD